MFFFLKGMKAPFFDTKRGPDFANGKFWVSEQSCNALTVPV
jgi:hypothetical protein